MADLMQYDSEGIRGVASSISTTKETVSGLVDSMYAVIRGFGTDEWSGTSYDNFVNHCDEFKTSIDNLISALEAKSSNFTGIAGRADSTTEEVDAAINAAFGG